MFQVEKEFIKSLEAREKKVRLWDYMATWARVGGARMGGARVGGARVGRAGKWLGLEGTEVR